jgi:hypothetical protein
MMEEMMNVKREKMREDDWWVRVEPWVLVPFI